MDRITKKDAEQALRVYCQRAGLPFGHYTSRIDNVPDGATYDGPTLEIEQNGRTFTAHLLTRREHKSFYVITGGLALACEYGGYQVQQIIGMEMPDRKHGTPCTGIRTPFGGGVGTAREIYSRLRGAIDGLELAERSK